MSNQSYANSNTPYWARRSLEDEVLQLELSVAFSSLTQPAQDTITTWDNQGVGVYPLTDNRGATKSTGIHVVNKDMSTVESIDFDSVAANPGAAQTVWVNSSDANKLYYGPDPVKTGGGAGGDFVGPASSVTNQLVQFADGTGKLGKACSMQFREGGAANNMVMTTGSASVDAAAARNIVCVPGVGPTLGAFAADNVLMGSNAGNAVAGSNRNIAIGTNALSQCDTSENIAIGYNSQNGIQTGLYNVSLGPFALEDNTAGNDNVAVGRRALWVNTIGERNIAIGNQTLTACVDGLNNVAVGYQALEANITGNTNIALGHTAGQNVTGSNNILIGNTGAPAISNRITIGNAQSECYIAGIEGYAPTGLTYDLVTILPGNKLGSVIQQFVSNTTSTPTTATIGQYVRNGAGQATYAAASAGITGTPLATNIEIYRISAYTLEVTPAHTLELYVDGSATGHIVTFDGVSQYADLVLSAPYSCSTRGGTTSTYAFLLGGQDITANMNISIFYRSK